MTAIDRRLGVYGSGAIKLPVRVSTTANITLAGLQTIDGVTLVAGDRVLVKEQTTAADNGVYEADTGNWARAADFDGINDVVHGTLVSVAAGTVGAGKIFRITTADPIVIGTTALAFSAATPLNSPSHLVIGTASAATDTAAVQAAVTAAMADGLPVVLTGTIALAVPAVSTWNWHNSATRPVYECIVYGSDVKIYGIGARIIFAPPASALLTNAKVFAFGCGHNFIPGSVRNVVFDGLDFDFSDTLGSLHAFTYGIGAVGVMGIETRNIRAYTRPSSATATITIATPGVVTSVGHGLNDNRSAVYFTTTGTLPTPLEPGVEYFISTVTTDTFRLTLSNGSGVEIATSGSQSGVHTMHAYTAEGRAFGMENVRGWKDHGFRGKNIRQAYFCNYVSDATIADGVYEMMSEALDLDSVCSGFNISNLKMRRFFGEKQCIDASSLSNSTIDNLNADDVELMGQFYIKSNGFTDYSDWHYHGISRDVTLTIASPSVVTLAAHGMSNGQIVFFEDDTPEIVLPTGLAVYTSYYIVNAATDTFQLSATEGGAAINTSGSQTGPHRLTAVARDPVPNKNNVLSNWVGTNLTFGNNRPVLRIATPRAQTPGDDRTQWRTGQPASCEDFTVTNMIFHGGQHVIVNECKNITIDGMKLIGMTPPVNAERGGALVIRQAIEGGGTTTTAESLVSGSIRNVTIEDSQGMGVQCVGPADIEFDDIRIDGYNLAEESDTRFGFRIDRPGIKQGNATIGSLIVRNGTAIADGQDFRLVPPTTSDGSDYRYFIRGPLVLGTTESDYLNVEANIGPALTNVETFDVPASDTSSTAAFYYPIFRCDRSYARIQYAGMVNQSHVAASATDYSRVQVVRRYNPGTTITMTSANPGVVTYTAHGLNNGDVISFRTTGALPSALAAFTEYYVVSKSTDTFQLATTHGGSGIDTSAGAQSGVHTAESVIAAIPCFAASHFTVTIASPGVVTWNDHGLIDNNTVVLSTTGALPTGLTAGTTYFVVSSATDTFQLSLTQGGAAINTSGSQSGVHTAVSNRETTGRDFEATVCAANTERRLRVVADTTHGLIAPNETFGVRVVRQGGSGVATPAFQLKHAVIPYTKT